MNQFNRYVALKATDSVGTMACVYAFAVLAIISLPAAIASHSAIIIVGWIAQTFLQLVLLPLLMVGQKLQADATIQHVNRKHEELKAHISKVHRNAHPR